MAAACWPASANPRLGSTAQTFAGPPTFNNLAKFPAGLCVNGENTIEPTNKKSSKFALHLEILLTCSNVQPKVSHRKFEAPRHGSLAFLRKSNMAQN